MPLNRRDFKVIPESPLEWERFFDEVEVTADTVNAESIQDDAVTTDAIATDAVTSTEIAANAVTTTEIADSNVTLAKLADVTADRILGRLTTAGAPQELTAAQVRGLILQATAITDASTAHSLNATFDNTEVEAALDALGTKINLILDELLKAT